MAIPTFVAQANDSGIILESPFFPSHPAFVPSANPISLVFTAQNNCEHSHHSTTPTLVQATIIFHLNDWYSLSTNLCTSTPKIYSEPSSQNDPFKARPCHSSAQDLPRACNSFKIKFNKGQWLTRRHIVSSTCKANSKLGVKVLRWAASPSLGEASPKFLDKYCSKPDTDMEMRIFALSEFPVLSAGKTHKLKY